MTPEKLNMQFVYKTRNQ